MRSFLLIALGVFALCADDRPGLRCPGTALDRPPIRLTDTEPFYAAVRAAGHTGAVRFQLTITDEGVAENPKFLSPERFNRIPAIMDRLREWRFCPGVYANNYKTIRPTFHMELPAQR